MAVNTEHLPLQLLGACIQVCTPEGFRLFRDPKDRNVRTHVLGEPGLVDLKVVVGHADANPASPRVVSSAAHD